jgi:hypothetical protein
MIIFTSKRILSSVLLTLMLISGKAAFSQISLTATGGTTSATYSTLGATFSAINSGTHTGTIAIVFTGNTTETSSAVLNASGTGSASYTTITISPGGGGARTITGSIAGPLIDLNGADSVVINGYNTGGASLSIDNSSSSTAAGTSTIRFINDATRNRIENVTLMGGAAVTTSGTVFFSTASSSANATGNDNNTITNCLLNASGGNFPANAIYCNGTATAGQENSNITISNNNITNFFSATLVTSGILAAAGATSWTISSNKFYQSATRTYTTANTHAVISILSGEGYTISGNTIGYSDPAGSGTYTMASTIATRFIAINLTVGKSQTLVQNNTIASISLTTSNATATLNGSFCGININSGNLMISGNTLGATSGTSSLMVSSTAALGALVGIHSASTGIVSIMNNTLGAFTSTGTAATISGSVHGISISGVATSMTIYGNTIGNSTADNMRAAPTGTSTAATIAIGVNATAACNYMNISKNIIRNFISMGTGAGNVRGIFTGTTVNVSSPYTIDSNIISNLVTNSSLANVSNALCAAAGISYFPGANASVSYNVISNISCTNATTTTHVVAAGIALSNAANPTVSHNTIYGIKNAGIATATATPAVAAGIAIRSGNGNYNIFNNMISLGNGESTNTSFIGIFGEHGFTMNPVDNIYFNTVNIEGTVSSGAQPSFCFLRGNFATAPLNTVTLDIRNNIFNNTRSGGTGGHYALGNYYGATTSIPGAGWGSDYNVLNANAATIGYWGTDQTISSWRTISGSDANSITGVSVNFTNSANDLHLNMGSTPTLIESGGVTIAGYTKDFDGQVRPGPAGSTRGGALNPDIGADEFDGVPIDIVPPVIKYAFIANTNSTANRTLTNFATITDYYSGVNTSSGTRPRLYFKKSTDNNTFGANTSSANGWKYVEASNTSSPYSFTINYSIINGGSVALNDIIQYFVIAQDLYSTPNTGSNPSAGFAGSGVGSITSAPSNPNTYAITNAFSGATFNVGSGQTYTSLTGSSGLFAAINNGMLSANTTVNITSDLSEDGTNALNASGLAGFTLTIKPSAASLRVISNSADLGQAMIRLNGASGVVFDGRFSGSGQYLRIINTHTVAANAMPAIMVAEGALNTVIRNCIIESNASSSTTATVVLGTGSNSVDLRANDIRDAQGTPGTAGIPFAAVYSKNTANKIKAGVTSIEGNNIYNYTNFGLNLAAIADSVDIRYNSFYQTSSRYTTFMNVSILTGNTHTVSNNFMYQTAGIDSGGFVGIYIVGGGTGHTINSNSIGGSNASRTGAAMNFNMPIAPAPYYVSAIFLSVGNSPATNVQGNSISNLGNMALGAAASAAGVFAINATSGNINIGTTTGNIIGGGAAATDTIVNGYDNGMINYTGSGFVDIENNNIGNVAYYSGQGDRNCGITLLTPCKSIIKNNTIHDISGYGDATIPTLYSPMGILVAAGLSTGSNIESNVIYNITCVLSAATGNQSAGIFITGATDSTVTVKRNRIYNIKTNGTGTTAALAPKACGIINFGASSAVYSNNQITIGTGTASETICYGIYDFSTGSNKYYYNSIYINGSQTGTNSSYCIYRASTASDQARNNIYYNGRTTSGTGQMCGTGIASAVNLESSKGDYNLVITGKSSNAFQYLGVGYYHDAWKFISASELSSITDTINNVSASNLFTSPSTGDLSIQAGNVESWWSNGLGMQVTGITEDYGSTSAGRSVLVSNGSTDIGSDEFTPTVSPPALVINGSHSNGGTEIFKLGSKQIASVTWGSTGTLPTLSGSKLFSGTWPNDLTNNGTVTSPTYFNFYVDIPVSGGSNYLHDFTLFYDDAAIGKINNENNILLAKKQAGVAGTWLMYGTTLSTLNNTMAVTGLKSFGEFTGSETGSGLGPQVITSNSISSSQTICNGITAADLTGTTPVGGNGSSYSYTWISSTTSATSGFSAASGTNNTLNYSPGAITVTTWYRRIVSSGLSDTSNVIQITVTAAIASNTVSSSQTICSGSYPSTLTGSTPTGGGGSYTYKWQVSTTSASSGFTTITGASSQNYSPGALTADTWYRRVVNTASCVDTSTAVKITILAAISNNTIGSAQTLCSGSATSTLTGSTPAGGGGGFTFQWLSSTTSATTGYSQISGATSQNYSPGVLTVTTWFTRIALTTSCADTSAEVQIIMVPPISFNTISSNQTLCANSTPSTLVGSAPGGGGGGYIFQWLVSTTSASSGFSAISGANSTNYTPGAISTDTWFRRFVTAANCIDTSNTVKITAIPSITNNILSSSQTICSGSAPATLTATTPSGGGGNYIYSWLQSTTSATSGFTAISGTNSGSYSPGALTTTTWYRRYVVATNCIDTSAAIQVTVNPVISQNNISSDQGVCAGTSPNPLTGTNPSGGGGNYSYQWLMSTTASAYGYSAVSGATSSGYSPPPLTITTWYRRLVTTATCFDTSGPVQMYLLTLPDSTMSGPLSGCAGSTSGYGVTNTPGVSYNWTVTGGTISSGAGTNAITVLWGSFTSGTVSVTIKNTTTSCEVTPVRNITIIAPPAPVISGPATACANSTQTYSVAVSGSSYSWTASGGSITGGLGTNTITVKWGTGSSGNISITEQAGICSGTDSKAVTLDPSPAVPLITRNHNVLSTTPVTGATYQWYLNGTLITGATSNTWTAFQNNGNYTVVITVAGCSTSSLPFAYDSTGLPKEKGAANVSVIPNPNHGMFTISGSLLGATEIKIKVMDLSGRLVKEINAGKQNGDFNIDVNIANEAAGVYILSIETYEASTVFRVVKE